MFALITPAAVAALLALLSGRSLAGLGRRRIAWWPLGFGSLAAECALTSTPLGGQPAALAWGSTIWLAALVAMVLMLARNAWVEASAARWAWSLAALGVALNVAVVAGNGGHMPQSQAARLAAAASADHVAGLATDGAWHNVAPMTSETRLAWLGDVVPEPAWLPLHNVMSIGDLLLASGMAAVIYLSTTPRRWTPLETRA